ncbi:hypothetical protein P9857_05130 [Anoxybacillus geothermalis]|uniref:hypothetical protein n=1 Tax=Geobacillus TaxID=129337 RepID=UPI0009C02325|nr:MULTISPECIES: hypothetical protein [Geobacillus]MED5073401.1 hypothetical protein [Anoxybacillus geothermalis]OQP07580.1 hypothetical protein B1690_03355 [Geobacillus sp. 46C-IIa]OQP08282.1 hypothetical protein B1692_17930 [Geobacillus thermoleovorans]OQP16187.1 hypothetical protein B1693_09840 [Geobacillus zalihae]QNU28260.1 hypothetical protein IC803_01380 [Geobacillus sp. 46C-IIa]
MERVRLSTRQEHALKWLKREYSVEEIMENFVNLNDLRMRSELEKLETLTPEQFALALCGWYEVNDEEKRKEKWAKLGRQVNEFKRGDIVYSRYHGFGVYIGEEEMMPFGENGYKWMRPVDLFELELIAPVESRFDIE